MTSPQAAVMGRLLDGLSALRAARPSFEERLIYIEDYPVKPVRRTRKRRPTLAGVARQAAKAGIEVMRFGRMARSGSSPAKPSRPSKRMTQQRQRTRGGIEMADISLSFVNSYKDLRNGTMRHVFRRRGYKKLLKGRPGSAEFMNHYAELLAQSENAAALIGASKIKPGSIDALVIRYLQSDTFTKGLAKATRDARRPILDNFRQCKTLSGYRYGENNMRTMVRKNISDALADKTPIMQKVWLKALRHLIRFAIAEGDCKTDPTIGITTVRPPKSSGHLTWTEVQIAQYRERHANGTMARLAMELMLNIAARRHDAHLIGRQHLRNGCLSWRPSKTSQTTGKILTIRMLPELQGALDPMPHSDAMTFLLTNYGRPFASSAAFGNKFADWCDAAGLQPVVCDDGKTRNYRAHGLRKAACRQLAHAGCTGPEIMAVSGHASLTEVQVYLNEVDRSGWPRRRW